MRYIGIDPGRSGAIWAWRYEDGERRGFTCIRLDDTEHDIARACEIMVTNCGEPAEPCRAAIEKVGGMPHDGRASLAKFMTNYGFLRGLLAAFRVPFVEVAPGVWQRAMGCLSGGDKNVTKAAAQRLWPSEKWTHATADAALIAEWLRRQES